MLHILLKTLISLPIKTMFIKKKINALMYIPIYIPKKKNQSSLTGLFETFITASQTSPLSVYNVHK